MRTALVLAFLLVVLAGSLALALRTGPAALDVSTIWQILTDPSMRDTTVGRIVFDIRLPRALLAMLVGACLSLAGTAFQGLLRNPLADPYIVGTSAGAALGAALAVLFERMAWPSPRPGLAFVAALLTMLFVYHLAQVRGHLPVETFLLAGVVVGSFLWAFVSFVLTVAREQMADVVFWLMGDLSAADWPQVSLVWPYLLIGLAVLGAAAHWLNLLSLGETTAWHLGVRIEPLKAVVIATASLVTAAAVSVSGLIGFVGLMVPHTVRALTGPDHRRLIPATAVAGAAFLLLADTLSRSILSDREIPVGVITALCGAPFFFVLLRRRRAST